MRKRTLFAIAFAAALLVAGVVAVALIIADLAGDTAGELLSSDATPRPTRIATPRATSSPTPRARPILESTGPMVQPGRTEHVAVRLADGRVFVAGGREPGRLDRNADLERVAYDTSELYDPATNGWTAGPRLPARRYGGEAFLLGDATVLIVGGIEVSDSGDQRIARPLSFDPLADTVELGDFPFFLRRESYIGYGQSVLMVNGAGHLMAFDLESHTWSEASLDDGAGGRIRDGRSPAPAELVALQDCPFEDPARPGYFSASSAVWVIRLGRAEADLAGVIATPPFGPVTTWLPDGRLLVHGGSDRTSGEYYSEYFRRFDELGAADMTPEDRDAASRRIGLELQTLDLWPRPWPAVSIVDPHLGTQLLIASDLDLPADLEAFPAGGGVVLLSRFASTRAWALVDNQLALLQVPFAARGGYSITQLTDGSYLLAGGHALDDAAVGQLEARRRLLTEPISRPGGLGEAELDAILLAAGIASPIVGEPADASLWSPVLPQPPATTEPATPVPLRNECGP